MKKGCKLHNNCFTCPFPDCIANRYVSPAKQTRQKQIVDLIVQNKHPREIATEVNVSLRTVQRHMRRFYGYSR